MLIQYPVSGVLSLVSRLDLPLPFKDLFLEHGLGLLGSFQAALPASWSLVPSMPSYLSLVFTFENRGRLDGRLQQNTHLASCWASSGLLKEGVQSGWGTLGACGTQYSRVGIL